MRYTAWHQFRCRRLHRLITYQPSPQISHGRRLDQFITSKSRPAYSKALFSISHGPKSDPSSFSLDADHGFPKPRQTQEAILDRARIHGIDSLERLNFEADLDVRRQDGVRILDDASARQDLDLWSIVLDYRRMKDGLSGIQSILNAMSHGGVPVKLYGDAVSGHIWHTMLQAALQDERLGLLYELCQVGKSFMQNIPTIFTDVVGPLLATGRVRFAIVFGTQYLIGHFRGRSDLLHLFDIVFGLNTEDAIHNFCQLTQRLPRRRIYDVVIPKLWAAGRVQHAFILHRHLISIGDYPGDFEKVEPFIQELATRNAPIEPFLRELESYKISFSHQARRLYNQERIVFDHGTTTSVNRTYASGPRTRPVKLSDAFIARTFATRSVSFDFTLTGLGFLGLYEIGPAAVREMALSANGSNELQKRFEQLEKMEVDLGSSNYVRVVSNLCKSGEEHLLRKVLDSDMHHEVFEDIPKQKNLLGEYLGYSDWSQADRTLAILNGGTIDKNTEMNSAQLVAQSSLIKGNWRQLLVELDAIRELNQHSVRTFEKTPLRRVLQRIWADIAIGDRLKGEYLDRHNYLVGFMQQAQVAGFELYQWQWRSVFHAVGRSEDWKLFHQLILSVARLYHEGLQTVNQGNIKTIEQGNIKNTFLNSQMQSFILEFSLTSDTRSESPGSLWLRGMRVLATLKTVYQIDINFQGLHQAFESRLMKLFRGTDSKSTRRRLVDTYLGQLSWAWSEFDVLSNNHDPGDSQHVMHQQAVLMPDNTTLRLFQLRARSAWDHRRPVASDELKAINPVLANSDRLASEQLTDMDAGFAELDEVDSLDIERQDRPVRRKRWEVNNYGQDRALDGHADQPVFYADLLHPSYRDRSNVGSAAKSKRQF